MLKYSDVAFQDIRQVFVLKTLFWVEFLTHALLIDLVTKAWAFHSRLMQLLMKLVMCVCVWERERERLRVYELPESLRL